MGQGDPNKCLKISKGKSEDVDRWTDNKMTPKKEKRTNNAQQITT
jgi:hypothetical protein